MSITGVLSLMYVPGTLIVRGNAGATASDLLAHETLFRLGIVSNLVAATIFIFPAPALDRLFKNVNQQHASLMVSLVGVEVPSS